jgi:hypothetical protein
LARLTPLNLFEEFRRQNRELLHALKHLQASWSEQGRSAWERQRPPAA